MSLEVLADARVEPDVAVSNSTEVVQFERQGYFVRDKDCDRQAIPCSTAPSDLRDTFAKEVGKG